MKNDNSEVVGRTVFDFLTELLKRHGVWVIFICIFFLSGVWLFAHFSAKEGSDVSILGIIKYTKGSTTDDKNETENVPQDRSNSTSESNNQIQHSGNIEEKEPIKPDTIETILSNEGGSQ
jgi:hypothetical protein